MNTKKIGKVGERIAEDYLKNKGYRVLEKNYPFRIPGSPQRGEIDIVAKKEDIISFIEVKTLMVKNGQEQFLTILPEEKVGLGKKKKLVKTAESWLIKNQIPLNSKWQIDVIAIEIRNKGFKISHFENAIPYY